MVNRIVYLIPTGTEIVAALEYGDRLVGRSHECDYPLHVGALPICTSPKFDKDASSIEIDRNVRGLVENALSVYKVHDDTLKQLNPDVIVTQSQCDICAVSRSDVEASVATVLEGHDCGDGGRRSCRAVGRHPLRWERSRSRCPDLG